jgi:predicted lipoprotein with Yx(FWY)xxD motif
MRYFKGLGSVIAVAAVIGAAAVVQAQTKSARQTQTEDYVREAMPPGFQVVVAELEGPVFADAKGKTLYNWPLRDLRNGPAGEQKGKPTCGDTKYTTNAGLMSPYPGGLVLPEVETRPTCVQAWPPVYAGADAQPVGKWTVLDRPDGKKQWAYDGLALYTSVLDHGLGDVIGGSSISPRGADSGLAGDAEGAMREPVGPPRAMPKQFSVRAFARGRLLVLADGKSVYQWDKDTEGKSNCTGQCANEWAPVLAPDRVQAQGEWSTIERSPGVKQWAFRKRAVYTHVLDEKAPSQQGGDVPGWHNVYTQPAPNPPRGFTVQDMVSGQVLADAQGRTIYLYNCNDDALDQLSCNHPDTPQAYRMMICGKGDWQKCLQQFPYVIAAKDARSDSRIWSVMDIDPKTGKRATTGQDGALHVWAYRDRPVYLCGRDKQPGDAECDAWGEFSGIRNGYKAFWLRDDFGRNSI